MIVLDVTSRHALASRITRDGVQATRTWLGCDEQTMMRAAVGVPVRDDVARRIASRLEEGGP